MGKRNIDGKYVTKVIGYCHFDRHQGFLDRKCAFKHKCLAKKCPYLEKYDEEEWKLKTPKYKKDKYGKKRFI